MNQIVFITNKDMDLVDYIKLREKHKKFKFDWEDNVWQNTEIPDDGWDNFMQRTRLRCGMSSSASSSSPFNECLPEGQNFEIDAIVQQRLVNHSIILYPRVNQETTIAKVNDHLGIQILPITMAANANGNGMEEIRYGFQGLGTDDANQTNQFGVYLGSHIYTNNSLTNVIMHSCIVEASAEPHQPSEPLKTVPCKVPTVKEFYLHDWHYHRPAGVWIKPIRGRIIGDAKTVRGLFYYIDEKTSSQMWSYFEVKQKDYLAAYNAAMLT